jgi:GTPase
VLNPEDVGNLEEALANLEAFRQYINPTYADGVAKLVEGRLDERNVNEWKAFFIGGRFAVEMANVLSRQPPGWKDFGKFLNRKTSVGATNYVRIQYSYNPEMLERGQVELSRRLSGRTADAPNLFKVEVHDFPNVYLL